MSKNNSQQDSDDVPEEPKNPVVVEEEAAKQILQKDKVVGNQVDTTKKNEPNMGLEEMFTCQICYLQYNDGSGHDLGDVQKRQKSSLLGEDEQPTYVVSTLMKQRRPQILPCGHTFCQRCIKQLSAKKEELQCPLDKIKHSNKKDFPVNFAVLDGLSAYNQEKRYANYFRRYCSKEGHKSESLNFYCTDHDQIVCQLCLIQDGHLSGCKIQSSEDKIGKEIMKQEIAGCNKRLNEEILQLTFEKMNMVERNRSLTGHFELCSKQIVQLIESGTQDVLSQMRENQVKESEKISTKIKEYEQLSDDLKTSQDIGLDRQSTGIKLMQLIMQKLDEEAKNQESKTQQPEIFEGELAIYIPKHLSEFLLVPARDQPVDPANQKMIDNIKSRGDYKKCVLDVFKMIDRKHFMNTTASNEDTNSLRQFMIASQGGGTAYQDSPKPIGWNTTISAPSMHAETLKNLYDHLLTAKNVLDIGTGSGYVTACMAHICPEQATIYSVDHIQEINQFAKGNIKKISPHFLRKDKINFVTADGRQGLPTYKGKQMQYDVIHVGGQLTEVQDEVCDEELEESNVVSEQSQQQEESSVQESSSRQNTETEAIQDLVNTQQTQLQNLMQQVSQSIAESQGTSRIRLPRSTQRKVKIDKKLLDQLAPGGRMWVPLMSKESEELDSIMRNRQRSMSSSSIFTVHEIYLVDRDLTTGELKYQKLMDCRYAQLRSVEEQLEDSS